VLAAAINQIPRTHRKHVVIHADGAGASHALVDWLTDQNQIRGRRVDYSVGFTVTDKVGQAIVMVPTRCGPPLWTLTVVCVPVEMSPRSPVCWICRVGRRGCGSLCAANAPTPAPSSRCSSRLTAGATRRLATNTATGQLSFLEARHRAHARVEDCIRDAKDTGMGRFPSRDYRINQAWPTAAAIVADLIAWLRLVALPDQLATAEPKALRYRLLHVPARLTHGARQRKLRIPTT
jgi:hypothetical protein